MGLRPEFYSDGILVMRSPVPGDDSPELIGSMKNPFLANRTAYLLNGNGKEVNA